MNIKKLHLLLALCLPLAANAQTTYSLEQCKTLAKENNVKLKRARLEIAAAKEQQKEARAKYLPQVMANGTYFHAVDHLVQEEFSMPTEAQQKLAAIVQRVGLSPAILASLPTSYTLKAVQHGTLASLVAMQPVFVGGRIINANKLADVQTQVKQLMLEQSADDVAQTTEVYFNQLLALYEQEKTLDAADKQLENILKDANNAFEAGVTNKNDVLSVKLKQNEMAVNRLKLNNGIALCKMVLAQYIGKPNEEIDIDRTLTNELPDPRQLSVNHASALEQRTEMRLLDKKVEANHLLTRVKQGEMLPSLAVGVAGVYHDLTNKGRTNVVGLATLSVPISNLWGNRGLKRQKIAEQIAIDEREDSKQLLLIQMQNAYNNLETAYKQIQLAKLSIEQASENLRLNQDYYEAGTGTMSNLLDAQTQDQKARNKYSEAVVAYLNARTAYLKATAR